MYHTIQFRTELLLDVEISPKHRLEKVRVRKGSCMSAQIEPRIVETDRGPVEAADLYFDDETTSRTVPYALFTFVDQ